jgi:phospholipase/carboxylesterase
VHDEASEANRGIPILAAHGSQDDVVAPALGKQARDFLAAQGYQLAWHEYPMPHSVCIEEIIEIGKWLQTRMGAAETPETAD